MCELYNFIRKIVVLRESLQTELPDTMQMILDEIQTSEQVKMKTTYVPLDRDNNAETYDSCKFAIYD